MDLFTFFLVVCLPTIFYAYLVNRRRKRSAQQYSEHLAALTARIYKLEEQTQQALPAGAGQPVLLLTAQAEPPLPTPIAESPARVLVGPETPAPVATPPPPSPVTPSQAPAVAIPLAAHQQPSQSQSAPPPLPPPAPSALPSVSVSAATEGNLSLKLAPPAPRNAPSPSLPSMQPHVAAAAGASVPLLAAASIADVTASELRRDALLPAPCHWPARACCMRRSIGDSFNRRSKLTGPLTFE